MQAGPPQIVPSGTLEMQMVLLYTAVAGVLTTLISVLASLWRERRQRKWDLEDRLHQREVQATAQAKLTQQITESNQLSAHALNTANDFNEKLNDVMKTFLAVERDVKMISRHTAAADAASAEGKKQGSPRREP